MTSPPYWRLRDYGVDGQMGLEPDFHEYIQRIAEISKEVWRVLRKDGSCYLNLGDTYGGSCAGRGDVGLFQNHRRKKVAESMYSTAKPQRKIRPKCLLGIPWRIALALIDDGWILRNDIIWHKPNSMPSSAKDRLTNTYEHVFHFVKSKKYYYNLDAIRVPHETRYLDSISTRKYVAHEPRHFQLLSMGIGHGGHTGKTIRHDHPLGKNPGDLWQINTKPHPFVHFAVYPEELCVRPILASSRIGDIVLDPFMGSGTTGVVAKILSRNFIGIDIKKEYVEIARKRLDATKELSPIPLNFINKVAE